MRGFEPGDVVRVPFPYTDRPIRQYRPALVVSAGGIGPSGGLLWVVMITSAAHRVWPGDVPFGDLYRGAGLPAPSIVRSCKIATIEARHAERLGRIEAVLLREVAGEIRRCLGLSSGVP